MGEGGLNLTTEPPYPHCRNPKNQSRRSDTADAAQRADSWHGNQCPGVYGIEFIDGVAYSQS